MSFHVVEEALIPVLDDHLARVARLADAGEEERAALELWDFRVCDPAMGSGHFIVDALDVLTDRIAAFLAERLLKPVRSVLAQLREVRRRAMHPATTTDASFPLTLADQRDAMLSGWLERHAGSQPSCRRDATVSAVITVLPDRVPEREAFCARWEMTVRRKGATAGPWTVLIVEGRALPVRGFTEITSMYRRA